MSTASTEIAPDRPGDSAEISERAEHLPLGVDAGADDEHDEVAFDLCRPPTLLDVCQELCPEVFTLQSGISYVQDAAGPKMQGGSTAMVDIPAHCIDAVFDAAEECPGECIFVEA